VPTPRKKKMRSRSGLQARVGGAGLFSFSLAPTGAGARHETYLIPRKEVLHGVCDL